MKLDSDKIILGIIIAIPILVINIPTIWVMLFLLSDLLEFGFDETCKMCIRTLQRIASSTGYSYEFWNVLLFIIIEPVMCLMLACANLFKSRKVRLILVGIILTVGVIIFNFIMNYYILESKSFEFLVG